MLMRPCSRLHGLGAYRRIRLREILLTLSQTGCDKKEVNMINFEEELKKFHPSLEIEDAADAIYNQDLSDMADIMIKLAKDNAAGNVNAGRMDK